MYVHILNIESMKPIKKFWGKLGGGGGRGDGPPDPRPPIGATVFYTDYSAQL